jgi:23S rRNA (pseudouridine1915-N3)-methyltransferase
MRLRILAIGTRMPAWVTQGFTEYTRRLDAAARLELIELAPGARSAGSSIERAKLDEQCRLLDKIVAQDYVVALDERGKELNTRELAHWLGERRQDGRNLAFLIGGPDGLGEQVLARADLRWSLSRLTFPHALVRVLLAEQLYRAQAVLANHPYHRE